MDIKTLESLADILQESPANRLAVSGDDWSVELERPYGSPSAAHSTATPETAAPAPPAPSAPPEASANDICAGMVGVFHSVVPAPGLGQALEAGAVLGTIESLAIRTEVRTETAGTLVALLVEDGQPVEYGQPLFSVSPLAEA